MLTLNDALKPLVGSVSPSFLRALAFNLAHETEFLPGHYGDYNFVRTEHDPSDPGGATRYGVDQSAHPGLNVGALTLAQAAAIYHAGEWTGVRGDDLPTDLALALFDAAVNVGTARAVRWLQTTLGGGLVADGRFGPATLAAVPQSPVETILVGILAAREHYYRNLPPRLTSRFLNGWLARLADLRAELGKHSPLPSA